MKKNLAGNKSGEKGKSVRKQRCHEGTMEKEKADVSKEKCFFHCRRDGL